MMDKGVKLVVVDMPNATDFQLHIYASLAQEERRLISERTKNALRQAKLRGTVLGKHGKVLAKINRQSAMEFSNSYKEIVTGLMDEGMGYTSIARYLNSNGYLSTKGKQFYPQTVKNLITYL
jgi:DNA invertase Pin-like site-specific DNA recombinase